MEVSFLNVGHGDSILINWEVDEEKHIGIVDCNKNKSTNPILDYLINQHIRKIDFIVLSHPHVDHYSGFPELFDYIGTNSIEVGHFIHTLYGDPKYLNWAEIEYTDRLLLQTVIDNFLDLNDNKKLIKNIELATQNWSIDLFGNYSLKAISPSDSEVRTRKDKINFYKNENRAICSSSSNYLSTVFVLSNKISDKHILLTSDATNYTLERLVNSSQLKQTFAAIQVPHHGSSKSLVEKFWNTLSYEEHKKAIISAGINKKYNLPDYKVVEFFHNDGFNVLITNCINGYKDYFTNITNDILELSNILDGDSELLIDSFDYSEKVQIQL